MGEIPAYEDAIVVDRQVNPRLRAFRREVRQRGLAEDQHHHATGIAYTDEMDGAWCHI